MLAQSLSQARDNLSSEAGDRGGERLGIREPPGASLVGLAARRRGFSPGSARAPHGGAMPPPASLAHGAARGRAHGPRAPRSQPQPAWPQTGETGGEIPLSKLLTALPTPPPAGFVSGRCSGRLQNNDSLSPGGGAAVDSLGAVGLVPTVGQSAHLESSLPASVTAPCAGDRLQCVVSRSPSTCKGADRKPAAVYTDWLKGSTCHPPEKAASLLLGTVPQQMRLAQGDGALPCTNHS